MKCTIEDKMSIRKCYIGVKSNDQEDKMFREKPKLNSNKGNGDLRARLNPSHFATCKRELKEC